MPAHRNSTVCTDEQDTTASSGGVPDQGGAPRLGAGVEDVPWEEGRGWLGNQLGKVGAGAGILVQPEFRRPFLCWSPSKQRKHRLVSGCDPCDVRITAPMNSRSEPA